MKMKNKKNTKKYLYVIGTALLAAATTYLAVQWYANTSKEAPSSIQSTTTKTQDTSEPSTPNTKEQSSIETPQKETEEEQKKEPQPQEEVATINQPPLDASFPVSTKEYVITKVRDNQYSIRLNAILNSPQQYDQYEKELRSFKTNALKYLSDRIGPLNSITITWTPANAETL